MANNSKIEWTDATWNPVRGCTKISPGCKHCYAETFAERFREVKGHPYEQGFDLRLVPEKLTEPFLWRSPKLVFVNSMSDLFHEGVPDEYIEMVCRVMATANWHTFQVLTKRSQRLRDLLIGRLRFAAELDTCKQLPRESGSCLLNLSLSILAISTSLASVGLLSEAKAVPAHVPCGKSG